MKLSFGKCPTCGGATQREATEEQTLGWVVAVDEEGRTHAHDPNRRRTHLTCVNGHTYHLDWYPACAACGWTRESR